MARAVIVGAMALLGVSLLVPARADELPTTMGDGGLFRVPSARLLQPGTLVFGLFRDNRDRNPKDIDFSTHGVSFAFGAGSGVEMFGAVGVQARLNVDALSEARYANEVPFANTGWRTGRGDTRLGAKVRIRDDRRGDLVALALRGHLKLPTASADLGLGTGRPSAGADLVISGHLLPHTTFHASAGTLINADDDERPLGNALVWGAGIQVQGRAALDAVAEVSGTIWSGGPARQPNAMDAIAGLAWTHRTGLFARVGVSQNLRFGGQGNQSLRTASGLQVAMGLRAASRQSLAAAHGGLPPTVHCIAERDRLSRGQVIGLAAMVHDPEADPVRIEWSVDRGVVRGTMVVASFHAASAEPGLAIVTVRVTDEQGRSAESRCVLEVTP